ncbi:BREX-2 system adenine-specific DNA-methyltransferase PglX [Sorangium sp. So ce327]|uniref:BREX-2 system adenine-specific DNA-methyltransferase PglX n=1 Tax=Sorangium sp. So ce327 TaxID=3133301 RepID=UPI003F61FC80
MNTPASLPPLADPDALVRAMSKAHRRLAEDLRARAADPRVEPSLRDAHAADRANNRTGEPFESYRDAFCDQVAASWVLCTVFARTLEDRGYLPHRLAGPGASDRLSQFRAQFKYLGERDYLLHIFDAISQVPGGREVFGPGHAPLWRLGPTSRALGDLLDELRATEGGKLRFSFGRPVGEQEEERGGASTRYLGDLYQNLNEDVRKRYALLQTPEFVERFILDNALDPAIRERGIAVTVLDPACGSGHLLLGAYDRLFEARRRVEPGVSPEESARKALSQIYGIDLNPYAAAVARFRLLLSYLDKARIPKLDQVPTDIAAQVYIGDSLLAGLEGLQTEIGDLFAQQVTNSYGLKRSAFSFFEPDADRLLNKTRFDVVVANPPYINEKDATKRELIRARYKAAAGKYALSAPFVERIFQLGNDGAYTGQITANSFMKREFGKALIAEVLPEVDLTEVVDTSGAYIPDHDTATVILFGRARRPVASQVRAIMGSRGEPTAPEVPAEGKVWSSIAAHHGNAGYEDDYISVTDVGRDKLAQHPWSLGGGGAAELKVLLEERAEKRLADVVESAGISSFTLEDDVYMAPRYSHVARGLCENDLRLVVDGDILRDWSSAEPASVVFPYDENFRPSLSAAQCRYLWPWRSNLASNLLFGGKTKVQGGLAWFEFGRLTASKLRTPLSIAFAEIATHNHFILDRGRKVFNRTAPIVKLSESSSEEEHLALLGYLNSSTACFWMKQVFYPKATSVHDVDVEKGRPEKNRYAFASTGLKSMPLPCRLMAEWGRRLDALGAERAALSIRRCITESVAASTLRAAIDELVVNYGRLTNLMVAAQEELDWDVYQAFGLCSLAEANVVDDVGVAVSPQQRPFAWSGDPPSDLPMRVAIRYRARRLLIEKIPSIRQIETAVYKRPWLGMQGVFGHNTASFRERQIEDLYGWLFDCAEGALRDRPDPRPLPVRALAHTLHQDPKVRAVAEVLTGSSNYDLEAILADLLAKEAVAAAKCQRYTESGLEKRALWEKTWDRQRREDAGDKISIDVPPKYDQKDFENAATVWRVRGKLDVPKERFIAYPTATPPPGATGKAGLVYGWAGWTHIEQLQAAIELWQEEIGLHGHELIPRATRQARDEELGAPAAATDEKLRRDTAVRDKLMPLLQTMVDLLPWVRQWHNEDSETADAFDAYVSEQARRIEVSIEEARAYRRPARSGGRGRKAASSAPKAAASGDEQLSLEHPPAGRGKKNGEASLDAAVDAVRALDQGSGVAPATLGERLGLSAAALKKTIDALVESGRLVERKKRPRLVSVGEGEA